jgi:nucleoside 2-deoxyribosyltransferase
MTEKGFTDEEFQRLKSLLEHEGFSEFLPYAKQAAAEAKMSQARRLVWQSYRAILISSAALIVAGVTFFEKVRDGIRAVLIALMGDVGT